VPIGTAHNPTTAPASNPKHTAEDTPSIIESNLRFIPVRPVSDFDVDIVVLTLLSFPYKSSPLVCKSLFSVIFGRFLKVKNKLRTQFSGQSRQ